jgi:hypothetical protein
MEDHKEKFWLTHQKDERDWAMGLVLEIGKSIAFFY